MNNIRFLREQGHNYSPTSSAGLDRSKFPCLSLVVEVLSGQHIPRPGNVEDDSDIVDPYVTVVYVVQTLDLSLYPYTMKNGKH